MTPIKTIEYKGHNIEIFYDEDSMNPRDDDNLGTMICFHDRYSLGDKNDYNSNDYYSWKYLEDNIIKNEDVVVILPLYLLDHSGITISTIPFNDRWDSGQVGFIFISKEKCREEYGWKNITEKRKDKVTRYLKGEVEIYDQYLRGEIYGYGYETESEGKFSCWGFFGDEGKEQMIKEAKSEIDYFVEY